MRLLPTLLLSLAVLAPLTAQAGPEGDALGTCLTDNSNGKDRKELLRWIFLAISAHPEIRTLSNASEADRTDGDKRMAALMTRLIAENCAPQMRKVMQNDANQGISIAFRKLGEVAMQELMTNPDVAKSIGAFANHVDKKKMEAAFGK